MLKAIAKGLETLESEERFWKNEVLECSDDFNLGHYRNARRALHEFKEIYKDQLACIAKWPFLAQ